MCFTQSFEHRIILPHSLPPMCRVFACLFSFIDDTPDRLNGSTNDSTFSIIVSIRIVGQIYRAASANTINFISIISFHICCFLHNCCASWFFFSFPLILCIALKSLLCEAITLLCSMFFFLILCYCVSSTINQHCIQYYFCHLP